MNDAMQFEFTTPTRIVFEDGAASRLSDELQRLGAQRPYLMTDAILRKIGLVDKVTSAMEQEGTRPVGTFDEIPPDSDTKVVSQLAREAQEAEADALIALGGGSVMDTAKAVNIVASLGGELADWQGVNVIEQPLGHLVCLPTTAGTGSEVSPFALVKDRESHTKLAFTSDRLCPSVAILDPELTYSMPPSVTAATGMDALTHAVEAILANMAQPMTDALAYEAIRELVAYLEPAVKDGNNREARAWMLLAAATAGMAFSNSGVGVVHALAHAAGGLYNVPHGAGNALFLPAGLELNFPVRREKIVQMARAFGLREESDPEKACRALVEAIESLRLRVGLPRRLRDFEVPEEGLESIAEQASVDGAIFFNPRELEAEELLEVLKKTY